VKQNKIHAGDYDKPVENECIACGKSFLTIYRSRRFCSNTCQHQYIVENAACPVCGIKLIEKGISTGRGYCSEKCKEEAKIRKAAADGRYAPCEYCGKQFIHSNERSRFCSKACYEAYQMERRVASTASQKESSPPHLKPNSHEQNSKILVTAMVSGHGKNRKSL